jgi:diadenosine tetraphosphatase ApaH/serine/threonine PP2A family protein phosphatase
MLELPKYPVVYRTQDKFDKIIAVGDVHGCYAELQELLLLTTQECLYDAKICRIFLGDLIDRGPNSKDCINLVKSLTKTENSFCVLGNHELKHLQYQGHVIKGDKNMMQVNADFLKTHAELQEDDFDWMSTLPAAIQWENFLFTHAGVVPGLTLNQPLKGFVRNRYIEKKNDKWVASSTWQDSEGNWKHKEGAVYWADVYNGDTKIVYGHEPRKDICLINNTYGIDTSCALGGRLTAMIIDCETKEVTFSSVRSKQPYFL